MDVGGTSLAGVPPCVPCCLPCPQCSSYTYRVVSAVGGRALDIHPSTRRATTYLVLPWYQSNQVYDLMGWSQWTFESHQGGCLDAYYLSNRFGPEVGTWSCHRGNNQQWTIHRRAML